MGRVRDAGGAHSSVVIQTRWTEAEARQVGEAAARRGVNRSELIREAVTSYLKAQAGPRKS